MPLISSDTPWKQSEVFWYFPGLPKEINGMKWVNGYDEGIVQFSCSSLFHSPQFLSMLSIILQQMLETKQSPEVSYEKRVLKNFVKFTEKQLHQSLFLMTLQASDLKLYQKRDSDTGIFSCEFCKKFKKSFFTEYL